MKLCARTAAGWQGMSTRGVLAGFFTFSVFVMAAAPVLVMFDGLLFLRPEGGQTLTQFGEVHFVPIKFRAVDTGKLGFTRHAPHIPMPSTISEFKLTVVDTPKGSVVPATACIIGTGPTATTS